jgi:hypothetical protein
MGNRVRLAVYGLLIWGIPFAVSFVVFPFREEWRSLFESIMAVTVAIVATALAYDYLRRVPAAASAAAGLIAGLVWMAISIAIDLPLMLLQPIGMPLSEYLADIGATYLMIPVIATGIGAAFAYMRKRQA